MQTRTSPHAPLAPDLPIRVTVDVDPGWQPPPDRPQLLAETIDLFARLVVAGAFRESCPAMTWTVSVGPGRIITEFSRLPACCCLAVLTRMLLVATRDHVAIAVAGTPAAANGRTLPPASVTMHEMPPLRSPLGFRLEIDPGRSWLCVEVTRERGIDDILSGHLSDLTNLWIEVARAGGFSAVVGGSFVPGDLGMDEAQLGVDFWAAQIAVDDVDPGAASALVNMIEEATRGPPGIDELSLT